VSARFLGAGPSASLPQRALVGLVDHCRRNAWRVVVLGILLAAASGFYASRHLGIDTDTDHLFAASLPWRQHQIALEQAFPQSQGLLVAVINADVPEAQTPRRKHWRRLSRATTRISAWSAARTPRPIFARKDCCFYRKRSFPTCWIEPSMRNRSWGNWRPTPPRAASSLSCHCLDRASRMTMQTSRRIWAS